MNRSIVLIDDHPLMRKGLVLTIEDEPDLDVLATFDSAEAALDELDNLEPDLFIVDLSLPGMSGLDFIKHVHAIRPSQAILVVSRHDEMLYAERVLRAGGRGYVMKLEADEVIVEAIRRILRGGVYTSEAITNRMLMSMTMGKPAGPSSPVDALSDRELEVFSLLGQGKTSHEIGDLLHVSSKTVDSYRARIKDKLNLSNSAELMRRAVQWAEQER
ncbi:MAG: response regulator transcription factor [Rhodothermales bacterium]